MTSEELLNCLTDRPCEVCKFHTETGCSQWSCIFEGQHENTEEDPCALCPYSKCEDAISRQAVIAIINNAEVIEDYEVEDTCTGTIEVAVHWIDKDAIEQELCNLPPVQPKAKWTPIKTRPLTEEERQYMDSYGDIAYDCPLPDDGQEVLVTSRYGYVTTDTFCRDDGGCYFETYCDDGDVLAWMPKPEPYKAESEDKG